MRYILTFILKYSHSALILLNYIFSADIEFKSIYFTFPEIAVEKLFCFFLYRGIKKRE